MVYRNAFPDLNFTIDAQIAEGDTVVTRWTAQGTHTGDLAGMPPTGRAATVSGVGIDRIVDGKVVESWGIFEQFGMLQQLGGVSPLVARILQQVVCTATVGSRHRSAYGWG